MLVVRAVDVGEASMSINLFKTVLMCGGEFKFAHCLPLEDSGYEDLGLCGHPFRFCQHSLTSYLFLSTRMCARVRRKT